jgi:hypothetical protein
LECCRDVTIGTRKIMEGYTQYGVVVHPPHHILKKLEDHTLFRKKGVWSFLPRNPQAVASPACSSISNSIR